MTRINLIPVTELSDQHLMAEYRELPRIVNAVVCGKAIMKDIPEKFTYGTGHIKFFYDKIFFLADRYKNIYEELIYRGFNLNPEYSHELLLKKINNSGYMLNKIYTFSEDEIEMSRNRIIAKLRDKPNLYKWTKRDSPDYF